MRNRSPLRWVVAISLSNIIYSILFNLNSWSMWICLSIPSWWHWMAPCFLYFLSLLLIIRCFLSLLIGLLQNSVHVFSWKDEAFSACAFEVHLLFDISELAGAVTTLRWPSIWVITLCELLEADEACILIISVSVFSPRRSLMRTVSTPLNYLGLIVWQPTRSPLLANRVSHWYGRRLVRWLAHHLVLHLVLL